MYIDVFPGPSQYVITVRDHKSFGLFFTLLEPSRPLEEIDYDPIIGDAVDFKQLTEDVAQVFREVASTEYMDEPRANSREMALRAKGKNLFERLVPEELRKAIRGWPAGCIVVISTNERYIPWEMLHDGRDFLGRIFNLVRMPRRHASDLRPRGSALNPANTGSNAKPSAQPSNGGVRNLVHVIGGGIDRGTSTERRKRCQEFFAGLPQASGGKLRVKCLVHPTPSDVANAAPSADILHLDCHGKRNPLRLHITDTSADKSLQLTPELVETGEVSVKPGSLVFGNACESGAAEPSWDGPQSFGWSFCRGGARAYIGTLGTVPTDEALNFSHRFYQIFVGANSEHPNPEGDILKAFRAAKTSNPFNLLYCLFCNPLMLQADRSCAESA